MPYFPCPTAKKDIQPTITPAPSSYLCCWRSLGLSAASFLRTFPAVTSPFLSSPFITRLADLEIFLATIASGRKLRGRKTAMDERCGRLEPCSAVLRIRGCEGRAASYSNPRFRLLPLLPARVHGRFLFWACRDILAGSPETGSSRGHAICWQTVCWTY